MSLANAARVLHWFKRGHAIAAVGELSAAMGWPKGTTSRLLKDMAAHGLLERDEPTRRYRVGLLMLELGRSFASGDPMLEAVDQALQEITRETGFSTGISILDGADIVVLRSRPGTHPLRVVTPPGTRGPAAANSTGRMLLGLLPREEVERRFTPYPSGLRPNAPPSFEELMARVDRARLRGWEESSDEALPGLAGVSIAIPGRDGRPALAPYIAFAVAQVDKGGRARLAAMLQDMAASLSPGGLQAFPLHRDRSSKEAALG